MRLSTFAVVALLAIPPAAWAGDQVELFLSPCRLYDSRNVGSWGGGAAVTSTTIDATDTGLDEVAYTHAAVAYNAQGGQSGCRVPAGATGIIVNLTVVNPSGAGYARLWAYNQVEPLVPSITFASGQTDEATGLAVHLGADGKISVHLPYSAAHVVVDITGWIEESTTTGLSGEVAVVTDVDATLSTITLTSGSEIWCQVPFLDPADCDIPVGEHVVAIGRPLISAGELVVVAHQIE